MTLPSRHRMRNSSAGSLRPRTLPLGSRMIPTILHEWAGKTHIFHWNLNAKVGDEPVISTFQTGSFNHCSRARAPTSNTQIHVGAHNSIKWTNTTFATVTLIHLSSKSIMIGAKLFKNIWASSTIPSNNINVYLNRFVDMKSGIWLGARVASAGLCQLLYYHYLNPEIFWKSLWLNYVKRSNVSRWKQGYIAEPPPHTSFCETQWQDYIKNPPPYFIVLASSVKAKELDVIEFHRISWNTLFYSTSLIHGCAFTYSPRRPVFSYTLRYIVTVRELGCTDIARYRYSDESHYSRPYHKFNGVVWAKNVFSVYTRTIMSSGVCCEL